MSVAVDEATRQKVRAIIGYIADHDHARAEEHLINLLATIADGCARITRNAIVRFELSCRGCNQKLIELTQTTEVIAGQYAPALVYSGGSRSTRLPASQTTE